MSQNWTRNHYNSRREWMVWLQNLGPFPVCFTGTDESLRISVPKWGDLVSCLCPKTAYLKLVKVWEGGALLTGAKNMFQSVLSSGNDVKYTRVGYLHFWTPAEERGLCTYKPVGSCHVLLRGNRKAGRREGSGMGEVSLVLQDLL